jgi:hypothetical protein
LLNKKNYSASNKRKKGEYFTIKQQNYYLNFYPYKKFEETKKFDFDFNK